MAEGRSSGSGERRVYRDRIGGAVAGRRRHGRPRRGRQPDEPGARRPRRARARRPWWQRLLLALIVVLAVAAVSFLIGYLIGLKLAAVIVIAALTRRPRQSPGGVSHRSPAGLRGPVSRV